MNKYCLIILLLTITGSAIGQNRTKIQLINSSSTQVMPPVNGKRLIKFRDGVFRQDNTLFRADSVLLNNADNIMDAYGHVNINQGDTLNIYSDKLNYNGNTKTAILTNNVKMIDREATLITNYFTYNTGTRIGTYTGGGKLFDKDNNIVSKNGYYFASSRDAYFRYDVVTTTPDAIIKTDTMRYNALQKITYFYGPTHIYGKKDNDTLYTENGYYNTATEQALFGKNNLYTQGTKSLKGDSLFYYRAKGYGRATRNVTFTDTEQKTSIYGDLGEYFKAEEKAIITQRPYMIFITEQKDTTKTAANINIPDSLKTGAKTDSATVKLLGLAANKAAAPATKVDEPTKVRSVKAPVKTAPKAKAIMPIVPDTIKTVSDNIKRDTLFMSADTIETQIITFKALKTLTQERFEAAHIDTTIKRKPKFVPDTKSPKVLTIASPKLPRDTTFYHRNIFGKPKPKPVAVARKPAAKPAPKLTAADSLRIQRKADSLELIANHGLRDTSRIRIISAYHHAKIYKSDLQSVADSMFYSNSDSTIRSFSKPMMWTQGSQLSGDTITMQMKNKKLDNIELFPNGFIVNIEEPDSLHFNQLSGKNIHGDFKDNKLSYMLVTGNAESRYFNRDSATHIVTDMSRSVSGMLDANFKDGKLKTATFIQNPEVHALPIKDVQEEDKTLKNFIWKPKDRPVSKESILPPKQTVKKTTAKPPAAKSAVKNTPVKKQPASVALKKDTVRNTPVKTPALKTDTVVKKKN